MAKEAGTAHFKAGEYREALACYSTALDDAAGDDVACGSLQSNISACHAALKDFSMALAAAERAVALRPDWPKAHSRAGAAHHGLGDLEAAAAAYRAAAAAGGDAASKDVALIEGLLRNQQLEALIERGAFNKRDDDDTGGGGASAAAARPQKREKTAEEVAYARSVKAWMDAAKAGDVDGLAQCLAAEPWLLSNRSENTSEKQLGNSALHWAAARGKPAALQWLLGRDGVDVNLRNEAGGTALHSAAAHARSKEVALLLDAGADASIKDETNEIARDAASRRGYKIVEAAIDRGPTAPARRATLAAAPPPTADEAKAAGNAAFAAAGADGAKKAVWHYTDALILGHADAAVLLSNRSAAHARLAQYAAALDDADAALALRPDWGKAHGRRAAAYEGKGDWARVVAAYEEGLSHDPQSAALASGLAAARERL